MSIVKLNREPKTVGVLKISLLAAFGVAFANLFVCHIAKAAERPNIVLIVADDLGWTGLNCYGSQYYETPNLDRFAKQGVKFTAAFAGSSNCAPSRGTLMSGLYTPDHGIIYVGKGTYQDRWKKKKGDLKKFKTIQPYGRVTLREGVQTLGENLQQTGYRTAMFGKWHLGEEDQHPSKRGFDVAIESHKKHFKFKTDPPMDHPEDQYLSDFLADHAVSFINESTPSKDPYFLYFADYLVHKPLETKQAQLKHFAEKEPTEFHKSPTAGAMIMAMDESVGRILEAIENSSEANNTLVVFTSDNGGLAYEEDGHKQDNSSNHPLREYKGTQYDGGLRVPWIVRWPGQTGAGQTCDVPVHFIDLFPTLSAVACAAPPPQKLPGRNLSSLFRDPSSSDAERDLFWFLPGYSAFHQPSVIVRRGRWKLIRSLDGPGTELFDTVADIGESNDLSEAESDLAQSLSEAAEDWLNKIDAPRMEPNPEYSSSPRRSNNTTR